MATAIWRPISDIGYNVVSVHLLLQASALLISVVLTLVAVSCRRHRKVVTDVA
jgi:hypothetical protein